MRRRSVKARRVRAAAAFREVINEKLGGIAQQAPAFLAPALTDLMRSNTRKWIMRIDKALRNGELDPYNVHKQMSAAVKSFLQAAAGVRSEAAVLGTLQAAGGMPASGSMQADYRNKVAALARPYYEPDHLCRSEREARLSIDRGKELIEKWV